MKTETVTFSISKNKEFSRWYTEICMKAELADLRYKVKGFVVYPAWSTISMKIMYQMYEKELQKHDHLPVIFPTVIPESNFQIEAEHVEGFTPEVFWITQAGSNRLDERLALRPTSETAMYPIYSLWIDSYRDLPMKFYQSGQVFRYEGKSTRPFIRGREFYWIEAHDVFATREEALKQVQEDMDISRKVIAEKFGIPFLEFERPQWDKFAGADFTFAADTLMPNGKFLQLPSTHMLGDRFAKAFGVTYLDEEGNNSYAYQTCYGPAISRIFGALISVHGDDSGLIFPWDLAPFQVVIVPIHGKEENQERLNEYCNKLQNELKKEEIRVILDNKDVRPGEKFYHWEMKGIPIRCEIGGREVNEGNVTIFRRDTRKKIQCSFEDVIEQVSKLGVLLTENIFEIAKTGFEERIVNVSSREQINTILAEKKVVRVPFCTIDLDGKKCAEDIKENFSAEVRGKELNKDDSPEGTCISCAKKATTYVVIGKDY